MKDYKFVKEAQEVNTMPPAMAWDRIEKKLDTTQPVKEPIKFSMMKWASVAAVLVFAISTAVYLNTSQPNISDNYMVSTLAEESTEDIYSIHSVNILHGIYGKDFIDKNYKEIELKSI